MQTTTKLLLILIFSTFVVANAGYAKEALATVLPPTPIKEPPNGITKAFCELQPWKLFPEKEKTGLNPMPSSKQVQEMCNKLRGGYPAETGGYQVK